MKFTGLLVAVVVLAGLAGGVYWSNKQKPAEDKKAAADAPPKILTVPEDQFKEIKLAKRGSDPVVLSKASGKWEITAPEKLAADQDSVATVVTSLASLTSDRLIDEKPGDLTGFGLNAPSEEVSITLSNGKNHTLLLGDDSPTGSGTYAKLAGDPKVYTVPSAVKTSVDKAPKDLRDKRLLTFNQDKLTSVALAAKGQIIEFGKNGQSEWQIVKPKPLRADLQQVDELVRKLKDAKMDTAVSDEEAKKAQAAFGSSARVATATTTDAGGSQTLEVRKDKDKNYYARSSAVPGIYKVTTELGEGLDKSLADFRNKKVFDFGFSDPSKVEVGGVTYQKLGDKWTSSGKDLDSASVQNVIDKLRDLATTQFSEKAGGVPVLALTVTSNDNKRVEKVNIFKLGDTYHATREGETSVYDLDSKSVDDLQKAVTGVKPAAASKPAAKKS